MLEQIVTQLTENNYYFFILIISILVSKSNADLMTYFTGDPHIYSPNLNDKEFSRLLRRAGLITPLFINYLCVIISAIILFYLYSWWLFLIAIIVMFFLYIFTFGYLQNFLFKAKENFPSKVQNNLNEKETMQNRISQYGIYLKVILFSIVLGLLINFYTYYKFFLIH